LGDAEDAQHAIAAAKRAFVDFGRTTKEERARILRRLHEAVSARLDDLTDVMIKEYGGTALFSRLIIEAAANVSWRLKRPSKNCR
jgi:aldehyde dehydrogenase (NAD+)